MAAGRSGLGFGEREAAVQAGLGFTLVARDEVRLLARAGEEKRAEIRDFLAAHRDFA